MGGAMKQIAILSGKGGTGKTSVAASLAKLAGEAVTADCDVDAANLALLMGGEVVHQQPFVAGEQAFVDPELCVECWACHDVCRFGAVRIEDGVALIDKLRCHGCHACSQVCGADAISFRPNVAGQLMISKTSTGPLVHAELGVGQRNSGRLATEVRKQAQQLARKKGIFLILIDGPPGIGCQVHATLSGVDLALAVVEPTISAEHDLERLAELTRRFRIPLAVAINKYDLSDEGSLHMERLLDRLHVRLVGKLPFDRAVPLASALGESLISVERMIKPLVEIYASILAMITTVPVAEVRGLTGNSGVPVCHGPTWKAQTSM